MKGSKDKIALVTGAAGLGRNIALAMAGNGVYVILTYRQKKEERARPSPGRSSNLAEAASCGST